MVSMLDRMTVHSTAMMKVDYWVAVKDSAMGRSMAPKKVDSTDDLMDRLTGHPTAFEMECSTV